MRYINSQRGILQMIDDQTRKVLYLSNLEPLIVPQWFYNKMIKVSILKIGPKYTLT